MGGTIVRGPWPEPGPEARRAWVDVTTGRRAPTRYLRGARVLNVFTGELLEAGVALWHDRIAYVGPLEPLIGPETVVDDLDGRLLIPGYVEIHAHPFQCYSPWSMSNLAASRGTTTLVCDTLSLLHLLGPRLAEVLDALPTGPARILWGLRTAPQTETGLDGPASFGMTAAQMAALLDHPRVVEVFEWTDWLGVIRRGEPADPIITAALGRGMPVDTHAPGASHRTLAALAAAGAGDCHESIRADEVLERLRLGLHVPLRHSSLRPDLPDLVAAVRATDGFERLMLTTDGSTPAFMLRGVMDQAVAAAVAHGVSFRDAVRMATLHPAMYLGLDRHLGAIAPGRLADLLVLPGEGDPVPEQVYVGGVPVARHQRLLHPTAPPDWGALGLGPLAASAAVGADAFVLPAAGDAAGGVTSGVTGGVTGDDAGDTAGGVTGGGAGNAVGGVTGRDTGADAGGEIVLPVIELLNAVITRRGEARLPVRGGRVEFTADPGLCLAVLLPDLVPSLHPRSGVAASPHPEAPEPESPPVGPPEPAPGAVRALVRGFGRIAGLATSYTCAFAPLVVGRDPRAMARALERILRAGGGISLWDDDGERFFLPLPVAGHMTDLPVAELAARCGQLADLLRKRGHPFHDPLYTLLFLTANHLPAVRLTRLGIWDVKRRQVLAQPATREGVR
ncbi:MAG TPA: adenine deaminase C-terminal domain-containing protein [Bacillota bacterium]